jgi:hypothetical protein
MSDLTLQGQKNLSNLSEYGFSDTRESYAKNLTLGAAKRKITIAQLYRTTTPKWASSCLLLMRKTHFVKRFNIAKNLVKLTLIYI